jgi:hypothetical protein
MDTIIEEFNKKAKELKDFTNEEKKEAVKLSLKGITCVSCLFFFCKNRFNKKYNVCYNYKYNIMRDGII